jgi:hypothetical protein
MLCARARDSWHALEMCGSEPRVLQVPSTAEVTQPNFDPSEMSISDVSFDEDNHRFDAIIPALPGV